MKQYHVDKCDPCAPSTATIGESFCGALDGASPQVLSPVLQADANGVPSAVGWLDQAGQFISAEGATIAIHPECDCPCCPPAEPTAQLTVTKTATLPTTIAVGQQIAYTIRVCNTGDVTVSNIVVTDPGATITSGSPIASLASGACVNVPATRAITAADMAAGRVVNTANASGTDPDGNPVDDDGTADTSLVVKSLTVTKVGTPPASVAVGQQITYAFEVCNTGNVALTNVTVTDTNAVVSGGPIATLAVGACDSTTFTATHTITAADIGAGQVTNQATASGTAPDGSTVSDQSDDPTTPTPNDPTIVPVVPASTPSIRLTKTGTPFDVDGDGVIDAGDEIRYTFAVTNSGNVALTNVTVTDANAVVSGGPIASLAVGATDSTTFTAVHVITAADIAAGEIVNQATGTGTTPTGSTVTAQSDDPSTVTPDETIVPLVARLEVTKSGALPANPVVGQLITYTIQVCNTGVVPLTAVSVADPGATITAGNPIGSLTPGQCANVTATRALTQAMIDAGTVANTATATGTSPTGATVTDDGTTNVTIPRTLAATLVKTATAPASFVVGSTITYEFELCNTGNLVITSAPLTDPVLGITLADGVNFPTPIAPGACATLTRPYTVTAADVAAGGVTNVATATIDSDAPGINPTPVQSTDDIANPPGTPTEVVVPPAPEPPCTGVVANHTNGTFNGVLNGVPYSLALNTCPPVVGAALTSVTTSVNAAYQVPVYDPPIPVGTIGSVVQVAGTSQTCITYTFAEPVTDVRMNMAGMSSETWELVTANSPGATGLTLLTTATATGPTQGLGLVQNPSGTISSNNVGTGGVSGLQGANGTFQIDGTYTSFQLRMTGGTAGDSWWMLLSQCVPAAESLAVTKTELSYTSPPLVTPLTGTGGTASVLNGTAEYFTWPNLLRPLVPGDRSNPIEWGGCSVRLEVTSVALNGPNIGPNGSFRPVSVFANAQHGSQFGANGFQALRGVNSYSNGDISFDVVCEGTCTPSDFAVFAADGETVEGPGQQETMRVRFNGGTPPTQIGVLNPSTTNVVGQNVTWLLSLTGNQWWQSVGVTSLDVNFVEPGTGGKQGYVMIGLRKADGTAPTGAGDPSRAIPGDRITYEVEVCNNGSTATPAAVILSDANATLATTNVGVLAPGQCVTTTAVRTVTAEDIASGDATNVAIARSGGITATSNTVVTEVCNPNGAEAIVNGSFPTNTNGWTISPAGTWALNGPAVRTGNTVRPIGQAANLTQTIDYPGGQPTQRIRFNLTAQDGTNLATGSGTLQMIVNGTVYATFTNPIGTPVNVAVTTQNGATLVQGKNPLSWTSAVLIDNSFYEFEIPAQPAGPLELTFAATRTAGPVQDVWQITDVSMRVDACP